MTNLSNEYKASSKLIYETISSPSDLEIHTNSSSKLNKTDSEKLLNSPTSSLNVVFDVSQSTTQSVVNNGNIATAEVVADAAFVTDDVQVNTHSEGDQFAPSIATLSNGDYVISWMSGNTDAQGQDGDGDGYGIKMQRYDSQGNKLGEETQVNNYINSSQSYPKASALNNGGFVISWMSDGQDGNGSGVYMQIFDAQGNKSGEETQVNTSTDHDQILPSTTSLSNGDFIVSWVSAANGVEENIYAINLQRFDIDGNKLGDEVKVNTAGGYHMNAFVASINNGGFVVSWEGEVGNSGENNVYMQIFDADGNKSGNEVRINSYIDGDQRYQSVVGLDNGNFAVSWASYDENRLDGDNYGIYMQIFDAQGNKVGEESQVNSTSAGDQFNPSMTSLSNGDFIVSWVSGSNTGEWQDGSGNGVYLQRFDINGNKLGEEIQVNSYTDGDQEGISITASNDGGFLVSWTSIAEQDGDGYGVFMKKFDSNGVVEEIPEYGTEPLNLIGTNENDILTGGNGNDQITGGLGMDILTGGNGNDSFNFNSFQDSPIDAGDIIQDFTQGGDKINLHNLNLSSHLIAFDDNPNDSSTPEGLSYHFDSDNNTVIEHHNGNVGDDFAIKLIGNIQLNSDDFNF